ncbi:sugar phosphate nucleotidyltransferase [Streptomyces uncialis]|uniref:sugar phosphate nucleotidyltransferase n=1 Tax=Streptomyces uncialis TaxID=1048205 RepID=UPI0033CFB280
MKAVVMAGGEGTRLRPMTANLPKPLLPVGDRPVMEHVLRLLKRHGIDDIVVTVRFLASLVENHFGDGDELGVRLTYAHEERPLGTAGSVRNAARTLEGEPFVVVSGDALTDLDLTDAIRHHREKKALVTVCLARVPDPLDFGITVLDDEGRVERFLEKPTWSQVFTDTVNTGIYIMEPGVLDHVAENESVDWSADVFPRLLAEGLPVHGYVADGYWEDIGSHDSYAKAQADILDSKVATERAGFELAPGVHVGEGAEIHPEAVLRGPLSLGAHTRVEAEAEIGPYTVVGRGSVVRTRAVVARTVLHENTHIGPDASLSDCVVGKGTTVMRGARLEPGVVIGDNCAIGEEAVLATGVRVYPSKTIEAGACVNTSVVWEERGRAQLFGARGVSGTLNADITPELAVRLAGAYTATRRQGDTVALATDHSRGARTLARCIAAALQAGAVDVRDLGTVPLPVLRLHSGRGAAGGIYVRTTEGRPDSVEILFVDENGADLSEAAKRRLDRVHARQDHRRASPEEFGALTHPPQILDTYVQSLTATTTDGGRDTGTGVKVVIDAAHGTVGPLLPHLVGRLGADALLVDAGIGGNRPARTADEHHEALARLGQLVRTSKADLGVRFDAVGERLTLVDDLGETVEDARAALIQIGLAVRHHGGGRVVLPVTVSRAAEDVAAAHGGRVRWVGTSMAALATAAAAPDVVFAGDGAGRCTVPGTGAPFDAAAALVALLRGLAGSAEPLSSRVAALPRDLVVHRAVATPWSAKGAVMRHIAEFPGEHVVDTTVDGVRVIEPDGGWALVLPDPSRALTRVYAEGSSPAHSRQLLDGWAGRVREAMS